MAKKVKHSDIIEEGLFNPSIENAKEFIKVLDEVEKEFKEVLKASSSITKQIPKTKQGIDNFAKAADQSRQAVEGLSKVEKQRERVLNQIATLETKQGRALEKSKIQLQEKRRAVKEELKAEKGLVNEYKRQSAILNKLRGEYKSLILTQGASSKQAKISLSACAVICKSYPKISRTFHKCVRRVNSCSIINET
jgi:DNA repair exonuclease SbcCD ATPase subunit